MQLLFMFELCQAHSNLSCSLVFCVVASFARCCASFESPRWLALWCRAHSVCSHHPEFASTVGVLRRAVRRLLGLVCIDVAFRVAGLRA